MIPKVVHNLLAFAYDIDSTAYILMAEGRWGEVWRPFANRVLGPMIARYTGFGTLQIMAGVLFFAAVFWLLKRRNVPPCRALPFLLAPWLVNFVLNIYMPDLVTCALTAAVFAAYAGCGPFAAIVLLPLAVMARESSAVIALVWLCLLVRDWICGRRSRWQIFSHACGSFHRHEGDGPYQRRLSGQHQWNGSPLSSGQGDRERNLQRHGTLAVE